LSRSMTRAGTNTVRTRKVSSSTPKAMTRPTSANATRGREASAEKVQHRCH
jgi:hypothetical protein